MRRSMSFRTRGLPGAILVTMLVLATAGCGDDDTASSDQPAASDPSTAGGPSRSGDGLTVIAEDIRFPQDEYRAEAGEVDVVYENQGNNVHTLVIGEVNDFKLTVRSSGDVDEGSVELEPGEYILFCDIPGHRIAGMEATLVVS